MDWSDTAEQAAFRTEVRGLIEAGAARPLPTRRGAA